MSTATAAKRPPQLAYDWCYGVCLNCAGLGTFRHLMHVEGGVCFYCHGDGWRLYVPKRGPRAGESPEREGAPRAERIEALRQLLSLRRAAAPEAQGGDSFLGRGHAVRSLGAAFGRILQACAKAGDLDVFDRAVAARRAAVPAAPLREEVIAKWRALAPAPAGD